MKTLAAILVRQQEPLRLTEVEIPPLRFGQVLVEVSCSGICGSQLGEIDGVKGPDPWLPHLLGHEGVGRVLECGEGVSSVRPGDRVVLHWRPGRGIQAPCPAYESAGLGRVNAGWVTTFNRHAVISENRLTPIGSGLSDGAAALMGCAVTTGFGVVNQNAHVKIGESVVVWGAGGIGLSIVQAAAMAGAYPVVAIDRFPNRLELAGRLGATDRLLAEADASPDALIASIRERVGPAGADVVVDNTGHPAVIAAAYHATSATGRTILVGVPKAGAEVRIPTLPLHFEKVLTGSHGGESRPEREIPRYEKLVAAGRLPLDDLVTASFPLEEINEAIAAMRSGTTAGRVMIRMDGPGSPEGSRAA